MMVCTPEGSRRAGTGLSMVTKIMALQGSAEADDGGNDEDAAGGRERQARRGCASAGQALRSVEIF
jgi:hypothetical protein